MSKKLHPWSMGNSNRSPWRRVGELKTDPDPTPQEIAALCLEIQADWSEKERRARRLWMPVGGILEGALLLITAGVVVGGIVFHHFLPR